MKVEIIGGADRGLEKYVDAPSPFVASHCGHKGNVKGEPGVLFCYRRAYRLQVGNPAARSLEELGDKGLLCSPGDGCGAYIDLRGESALADQVKRMATVIGDAAE